ncbi:hypothetical protein [Photobacterium kishitanii]|uniref:hypothetical protein n=1 Tax=Photobacterium kishitanii TaxID=318456 RepID=UPI0011B2997D|nr:hypothetical protein [Photobacterium kishitanii]
MNAVHKKFEFLDIKSSFHINISPDAQHGVLKGGNCEQISSALTKKLGNCFRPFSLNGIEYFIADGEREDCLIRGLLTAPSGLLVLLSKYSKPLKYSIVVKNGCQYCLSEIELFDWEYDFLFSGMDYFIGKKFFQYSHVGSHYIVSEDQMIEELGGITGTNLDQLRRRYVEVELSVNSGWSPL